MTSERTLSLPERSVPLHPGAAAALVFGSSAAVLVVEIVALRLLAPYLGLTLETSTIVIGLALAAIALGSESGGRAADVVPPRRTLGPLLGIAGLAVAATPFLIRSAAAVADGALLYLVAGVTLILPSALLAAVTPMVTKLQLTSLEVTGTVVGRLSSIGTVGAITGTVVTGFVLISRLPVTQIMIGLGVALGVAAIVVDVRLRSLRSLAPPALLIVVAGAGAAIAPGGCTAETAYHCAVVRSDPDRPGGRTLVLDGARHSYVDLADPRHLEFPYVRALVAGIDSAYAAGQPLRAYHLGGGGLTVPRYLAATRPGTRSVVSEIDPGVVELDVERLGLVTGPDLEVRVEDGRLGLRGLADDSQDLVVGDAFGGVSVPWHLTTVEAVREVSRVLTGQGAYAVNLIDGGPQAFARAEVATLQAEFGHVALAAETDTLYEGSGGNLVAVASHVPLDLTRLQAELDERGTGWRVLGGAELAGWVGDAWVLTDDYAPVDQLLTPYAR